MILDIFALIVMAVLITFVIFLAVKLGPLPGKIATQRGHPQADAINVLGCIGVLTLGLAWPLALIWAYTRTAEQHAELLNERVAHLEVELSTLKAKGADA